jgi:putative membrane protein
VRPLKRWLAYLLLLLVLCFGVLFSVQNTQTAALDLLLIQLPEQRIAFWVLLAFALGGVVGILISAVAMLQLKSRSLLLERKLAKCEKELSHLRTADLRSALPANTKTKTTLS